ncbi:NDR1/HIN1-like protein 13 [Gastrolobium bilobum]|uniref:NDR1/HIN1-like protein 13 n=1 Tax=Gastrolobium bilobum TaxID=150636 RepID=UPI002AB0590E|nr:NDR1/HIN1-like protein 13 [Gastrolobium bilobum]
MESAPQPKPILQKPPGYRDPNTQPAMAKPLPPRKPVLPPSFRPKPKRRGCCRICCCTCCIIILVLIFASVIAAGLIYVLYDPSVPEFHLTSFRVPKLNITDKGDGAYLDADTATRVEVKNRNSKIVWQFEQTSLQILADNGDLNLGSTKVSGFTVKEKGMSQWKGETSVRGEALDAKQKRKLKSMIESKALIPTVEVQTRTGFSMQGWKSGTLGISVVCGDVTMRQIENGDMPRCSVTVLKW